MVHFISLVYVLVFTITSCVVTAEKQQKMRWLERRLNSLANRLNKEVDQKEKEYAHIIDSMWSLNMTIIDLHDMLTENGAHQNTDRIVSHADGYTGQEFERRITTAFNDEKTSQRKTIDSLINNLALFKKQQQQSRKDETKVMKNEVKEIEKEFRNHQHNTRKEIDTYKTDGQLKINVLRDYMNDKMTKQESKSNECFDTLIELKQTIQKMKSDTTGSGQESKSQSTMEEKSKTCAGRWIMYNGFCYRLFSDDWKVFAAAAAECAKIGAHLVDIQNEEENDFVRRLMGGRWFWLGLRREMHEWRWDGTNRVATYTNWYQDGKLIDYRDEVECSIIAPSSGVWYNVQCFERKNYICKTSI